MTMASQSSHLNMALDWESKVAKKRASRQKAIPEAWTLSSRVLEDISRGSDLSKTNIDLISLDVPRTSGILSERELEITESYNVSSLLEGLASGRLTSFEVTLAFSKRAAIAQQLVSHMRSATTLRPDIFQATYLFIQDC